MKHNGFVPHTEPPRDPADVIIMVHKLLSGGKSYAALLECERWIESKKKEVEIKGILEFYDRVLEARRKTGLTNEEEHS